MVLKNLLAGDYMRLCGVPSMISRIVGAFNFF